MSNNNVVNMLTAYNQDPDNEEVLRYFETDNIWRILDIQRYEPSHSAFLAWFFSQKTTRYCQVRNLINLLVSLSVSNRNNTKISIFEKAIITGAYSIKTVSVTPEMLINRISTIRYTDRIDIYIRCIISIWDSSIMGESDKCLEIIIENKVDSPEGKNKINDLTQPTQDELKYKEKTQTERYYFACSENRLNKDVDHQLYVFLSPKKKKSISPNYILLTYQDLVDYIFENFLKRKDVHQNVKTLVEDYLCNLGNPFNKNNKEIIAMSEKERDLLVDFFERNKPLFEATIQAMISQAEEDGDIGSANELKTAAEGLKQGGIRRFYTINGEGKYKMYQVIEEFIKFKLNNNSSFDDIKKLIEIDWNVGNNFIDTNYNGVRIGSSQTAKPHFFDFGDTKYYVTKELGDKKKSDNFYKFRINVNTNYKESFEIVQI